MIRSFSFTAKHYSDHAVVEGLQKHSRSIENWFYTTQERYFNEHFNEIFFDKDRKQEVFQTVILKLWAEIENGKITVLDDKVQRQQRDGNYSPMTCSLSTFLMTFAKYEYREITRKGHETYVDAIFDNADNAEHMLTSIDRAEDPKAIKARIIDDCIAEMSPRCIEVLTLFYYEEKTLDEILEMRKDKNTSKNGLKTAKNKCMTTLRERATSEFQRIKINY